VTENEVTENKVTENEVTENENIMSYASNILQKFAIKREITQKYKKKSC